jgi:putative FmdB family regulatory protein
MKYYNGGIAGIKNANWDGRIFELLFLRKKLYEIELEDRKESNMPIHEYLCNRCGATSEFLTGIGNDEVISCKKCGSLEVERIMSAASYLSQTADRLSGHTCCGREERCEKPPCSSEGRCRRD